MRYLFQILGAILLSEHRPRLQNERYLSIRYSPFWAFITETNAWDTFGFYCILCLHCTSFQSSMLTKCPSQAGLQCNVSIFEMGHSSFRCPFRHSIQTATPSNARKVPQSIVPLMSPFLLTAAIYSYFL